MKKVILGLSILAIVGMFLVIGVILIGDRQKQAEISSTQEEQAIEESDINQFLQLDFVPLGQKYVFFDKESANHYYFTWNGASEDYYLTWIPINFQCENFENPFVGIEFQSLDNSEEIKLSVEFDSHLRGRAWPNDVNYDWDTIYDNKQEPVFMNNHYILRCDYPDRLHLLKIKVNSSENACGEYKFKMIFKGLNAKKKERDLIVGVGCDFLTDPSTLPDDVKPHIHGCYNERSHFTVAGYETNSFINPDDSRINEIIEKYILNEPASTTEALVQKVFNFVRDHGRSPTGISFNADIPDFAMAEDILNKGYFEGGCSQHVYLSLGLLRNLGIPARMIYFIFTNKISDHSAVEVWIPGKGWKIYDSAMDNLFDETFYQLYFGDDNNILYAFAGVAPFSTDTDLKGCDKEDMAKYRLFTVDRSSTYGSNDLNLGFNLGLSSEVSGRRAIKLKWMNIDSSTKISELRFYIKDQIENTLELQPRNPENALGCEFGIKLMEIEQTQELEEFMGSEIRKTQYIVEYNGQQHITYIE